MAIICIIILIASLIAHRFLGNRTFDFFSLFCWIWIIIISLGVFNFYNLYTVSEHFYTIILIGVTCWLLGFLLSYIPKNLYVFKSHKNDSLAYDYRVNYTALLIFVIIIGIFLLILVVRSINFISIGNTYSQLHIYASGGDEEQVFSSNMMNQLHDRLMFPLLLAIVPVCVEILLKEKTKFLAAIGIALVVLYSLVSGRRIILIYLIVDFILALPLFSISVSKKTRNRIIFFIIIMILVGSFITALRKNVIKTGEWGEIYRQFVLYFNLCLPVGDYWVEQIDKSGIMGYGTAFFRGIINNIDFITRQVGIRFFQYSDISRYITDTQSIRIFIGSGQTANAFVTWVYYLYLDFREIGVALGSLFFGTFAGYIQRLTFKRRNLLVIGVYLLFAQSIIKSFVRWEFGVIAYPLAFLFLRLLYSKVETNVISFN